MFVNIETLRNNSIR